MRKQVLIGLSSFSLSVFSLSLFSLGGFGCRLLVAAELSQPARSEVAALPAPAPTTFYTYEVMREYAFPADSFTQGLFFVDGRLIVSSGLEFKSYLAEVDLSSGLYTKKVDLPGKWFAEGATVLNSRIYQLTWLDHLGFVYDAKTLKPLGEFSFPQEGWGLTTDGTHLIVSDGTEFIRFYDPNGFQELRSIQVHWHNGPVPYLNELEWIDGRIWANIWHSTWIAQIDPKTGWVLGWVDLSGLEQPRDEAFGGENVLNGIAFDAATGSVYVTGKYFPKIYQIKLKEQIQK